MSAITFQLMPKAPDGTPKEDGIEYCSGGTVSNVEGVLVFPLMPTGRGECVDFRLAPWPVVDFAADPEVNCTGVPVQFTNLSDFGEDFLWDFGDGNTSTEENPTHTYSAGGYKRVELTVGNIAGERTLGRNGEVEVKVQPVAALSYTATNLTVSFSDDSTGDGTGWAWNFGDGNTSAAQSPSHTYAAEGTYTVTLVVSGAPCAESTATESVVLASAATWHIMSDDTFWTTAPHPDWSNTWSSRPWDWEEGYCAPGMAWIYYGSMDHAENQGENGEVTNRLVPKGTWAEGFRPTKISVTKCGRLDDAWLLDTAGNVLAHLEFPTDGTIVRDIVWQGADIAALDWNEHYHDVWDISFYGSAPA